MRYAVIENNTVVNVVLADEPLAGNWMQSDEANIGWSYDGTSFIAPPEPVPTDEMQRLSRVAAYASEADPLFFKWQAGEGTKEDWEAKREEIRARYPYAGDDA
jgi:hypothetical protein